MTFGTGLEKRGSLTVPGYPTKRLGSELRANTNPFGNLTLTQSQTDIGQFQSITLPAMDGTYGPNLTSLHKCKHWRWRNNKYVSICYFHTFIW